VQRWTAIVIAVSAIGVTGIANAQGFAALVSPPRFELAIRPGKTTRGVFELSNRSTAPARFRIHTADWSFSPDFTVAFHDDLQPGSCRPWVAIERPEVLIPGGSTMRYRFEVKVPADAAVGECRFGMLIEGAEPSIAQSRNLQLPVSGRIGVIVYVRVGDSEPKLQVFGPKIVSLNGQRIPTLRVYNGGNAHGRVTGFLHGTDTKGIEYDITPSDFPILPLEEREVFLTPSTPTDDHPTVSFPIRVRGTFEWGSEKTELDQIFE
jgi:hypothetical protein